MDLNKALVILLINKSYSNNLKRRLFAENQSLFVEIVIELCKNIVSNSLLTAQAGRTTALFVSRNKRVLGKLAASNISNQAKGKIVKNNFIKVLDLLKRFGPLYVANHDE